MDGLWSGREAVTTKSEPNYYYMSELSTSYHSHICIQYLLMRLKIKNPIPLKTEDEWIRSYRTFLTPFLTIRSHILTFSFKTWCTGPHHYFCQCYTSWNYTFMQPLYKTLWMLPFGLQLACTLLGWFCTQICPRHSSTYEGNNGFIAHGTWYLIIRYTSEHNPYS